MGDISDAIEKRTDDTRAALTLRDAIKKTEQQFAMALPSHVDSGRFVRAALTAINTVPKLAECTQTSILAGLMQAAQLGLEVADVRGQAYLIPRWNGRLKVNEAAFQLGYRGMIDLAARSGITIDVDEICEGDTYRFQRGTNPNLEHVPTLGKSGPAIAYYAVAHFADGRPSTFAIAGRPKMEEHRDKFASSKNKEGVIFGPWADHFDAMARKTVVRKLLGYLPVSVELGQAVAVDAQAVEVETATYLPPVDLRVPPAGVDAVTGEIEQTTVIEVPE